MSLDAIGGLDGVVAVLVTPYRDDRIDVAMLERLAARVEASGIHAVTALGNTAEVFQLTAQERRAHVAAVARTTSAATSIAGTFGAAAAVLSDIDTAASLGYRLAMIHEPADPFGDAEGVAAYYASIAERSALPLVLYLRSERLGAEALGDLVARPEIVGVKYAAPRSEELRRILDRGARASCVWINGGAESRAAEFLSLGVTAFTSGIAVVRPDLSLEVHRALVADDSQALAAALAHVLPVERLRTRWSGKHNVAVLKELLRIGGFEAGEVRPPHSSLDPETRGLLRDAIADWPPVTAAA